MPTVPCAEQLLVVLAGLSAAPPREQHTHADERSARNARDRSQFDTACADQISRDDDLRSDDNRAQDHDRPQDVSAETIVVKMRLVRPLRCILSQSDDALARPGYCIFISSELGRRRERTAVALESAHFMDYFHDAMSDLVDNFEPSVTAVVRRNDLRTRPVAVTRRSEIIRHAENSSCSAAT